MLEVHVARRLIRRQTDQRTQSQQRQHVLAVAVEQHLFPLHGAKHVGYELDRLADVRQRNGVGLVRHARQEGADDGQRQGQPKDHCRPLAWRRAHAHRAAERAHTGVHGVETDAAAGKPGHAFGRGEAGPRNDSEQLLLGKVGLRGVDEPLGAGLRQDPFAIDAAAVVTDLDDDRRPVARRAENEATHRRLARRRPLLRRLDAMIDGVSEQVHHGVADLVEHRAIQLDVFAVDRQLDLFADRARGVTHDAGESVEDLPHRHHATYRDLFAELADEARRLRHRLVER